MSARPNFAPIPPVLSFDLERTDAPLRRLNPNDKIFVVETGRNHLVWDVDPAGRPCILMPIGGGTFRYLRHDEYEQVTA